MKSIGSDNTSIKTAGILLDLGCIILRPKQPFKFNTGIISPVYTDNRLILSSPLERKIIANFLIAKVKKIGIPDVIAGTATAGIPHAAFIAHELNLPMIYVRPKPKEYGKKNSVEGSLEKGQKVIVVDDLISTARSSLEVVKAIRGIGGKVSEIIAITTYGLKEADRNLTKEKVKLSTLTNLKVTCQEAIKKGILKPDSIQTINDWAKNPANWAKKVTLTK